MPAESAAQIYQDFEPATYRAPHLRFVDPIETERLQTELESLITRFDQNWREEGLPRDWYNFGKAGFSMSSQMNLLPDLEPDTRELWTERTEQDIRGFTVEYLKQDLVHPSFYRKVRGEDGRLVLVDEEYNKPLMQMVDPRERNGAVTKALGDIQDAFDNGKKAVVMTSPSGWTELYTDRGIPIEYPDSWLFGFIDQGERVVGIGIKTDFSLTQCREAIVKLTGQDLPDGASVEDYVRAVAKIEPDQGISSPQDLVRVLREVRPTPYVHKDRTWDEVEERAGRLEVLYNLEIEAETGIREFRQFAGEDHTKFELQKALAVILFRLSKLYLEREKQTPSGEKYKVLGGVIYPERFQTYVSEELIYGSTYGQVLNEVEKIPGCAGGGQAESVASIVDRLGIAGSGLGIKLPEDKYGSREVECPSCGKISIRPKDKLIPQCFHCGSNKVAC